MNILLVENHAVFAQTVTRLFLIDHQVRTVATIVEALAAVTTETFQVALIDFDLDDGQGDELVRQLRARGFPGRLVGISARQEGNEAPVAAGANACCPKSQFHTIARFLSDTALDPHRQS